MFALSQQPKLGSATKSNTSNSILAGTSSSTTTQNNNNGNSNENLFLVTPFGGQIVTSSTQQSNKIEDKQDIETFKIKDFQTKPNTRIGFRWSSDNQLTVFNFENQNKSSSSSFSAQRTVSKSLHRFNLFPQSPDARKVITTKPSIYFNLKI